jgi:hypothetical protein
MKKAVFTLCHFLGLACIAGLIRCVVIALDRFVCSFKFTFNGIINLPLEASYLIKPFQFEAQWNGKHS